ncbi:hypothetical protein B9Z55_026276 [Caenorhabditis nigoni]|uniref:CCDC93 N-terminal domain-containing protein n=1 Tax=Caenorhabditis nigoni TaxID=1611254 RepID=A0A2G5T2G7_9PELO|nr:hypothetical protein B9Z55_026276 [Caenorhabditis nigoni]
MSSKIKMKCCICSPNVPDTPIVLDKKIKSQITIQYLLDRLSDCGYHRARVKNLSNYDKIFGGISWATKNIDPNHRDIFMEKSSKMKKTLGAKRTECLEIAHRLKVHKEYPHPLTEDDLINLNLVPIYALWQWLYPKIEEEDAKYHRHWDYIKHFKVKYESPEIAAQTFEKLMRQNNRNCVERLNCFNLGMLLEENESIEDLFQSYFEYESTGTQIKQTLDQMDKKDGGENSNEIYIDKIAGLNIIGLKRQLEGALIRYSPIHQKLFRERVDLEEKLRHFRSCEKSIPNAEKLSRDVGKTCDDLEQIKNKAYNNFMESTISSIDKKLGRIELAHQVPHAKLEEKQKGIDWKTILKKSSELLEAIRQDYKRYTELGEQEEEKMESDDDIVNEVCEIADIAENAMNSCKDVFDFIENLPPATSEYESTNRRICEAIAFDAHHMFVDLSWKTGIFRNEVRIMKEELDAEKIKNNSVIRKNETQKTVDSLNANLREASLMIPRWQALLGLPYQ